ncbi:MAG: DUF1902 domain-containing protein [Anaerolineaceae bacterium]|nr:DUF1902 domain-containing protein [Anaerolineaceae bacterium]
MNSDILQVKVNFLWDQDAEVWVATSDEVPGLVLESGSFDALIERVKFAIPELLILNGIDTKAQLDFHTERKEMVYA